MLIEAFTIYRKKKEIKSKIDLFSRIINSDIILSIFIHTLITVILLAESEFSNSAEFMNSVLVKQETMIVPLMNIF